jgi:hypothetical protein
VNRQLLKKPLIYKVLWRYYFARYLLLCWKISDDQDTKLFSDHTGLLRSLLELPWELLLRVTFGWLYSVLISGWKNQCLDVRLI